MRSKLKILAEKFDALTVALTTTYGSEVIAEWMNYFNSTSWTKITYSPARSAHTSTAIPSLCKEEMDNELAGNGVSSATAFVNNGLRIEAEMCVAEMRYIYLILILIAYQASYRKTHCN